MSETAVETPGAQDDTPSSDADQHDPGTGDTAVSQQDVTAPAQSAGGSTDAGDDRTARTIAAIRDDFKAERAKRQAAEKEVAQIKAALDADKAERTKQMDALAIALGLKSGDEPPDPAKLAEELRAARTQAEADIAQRDTSIRQSQVELAVLRNAGRYGGNGDALLDSRSFMGKVSGLDPAADSFGDDLAEAIKAAVEAGPRYKAAGNGAKPAPAVARSGGEHTTPGGNRQWTVEDVRAVKTANDPVRAARLIEEAVNNGLLVDLGYSPSKNRR